MAAPGTGTPAPRVVHVSPSGPVRTVREALAIVARGGTVVVHPGVYHDTTIVVSIPVSIVGDGGPVLDGDGTRQIVTVTANGVTLRGLRLRNVGVSFTDDLAAIQVAGARDCVIADNEIDNGFFGIYLAEASRCLVARNVVRAGHARETRSGNGIHLWHSRDVTIVGNHVTGHRDGIYFEFVRRAHVRGNLSERNLRYGLHFMYSDSCDYERNTFRRNGAGVAVMYTRNVRMTGNRFADNLGPAAYGLLLKEITDSRLDRNVFSRNTTALVADGASRLSAEHNDFVHNGWALRLSGNTEDARFAGNNFAGNTFDVATNSMTHTTVLRGNYWSAYEGYDLRRDGVGDVPYRPVRLTSVVVARYEPAVVLLRSGALALLDVAERVLPSLTPEALVDSAPSMRWVR